MSFVWKRKNMDRRQTFIENRYIFLSSWISYFCSTFAFNYYLGIFDSEYTNIFPDLWNLMLYSLWGKHFLQDDASSPLYLQFIHKPLAIHP